MSTIRSGEVVSDDWLSYTNFGELGQIITSNWAIFSDMFTDQNAFKRQSRGLIRCADLLHCLMLAEDEVRGYD